MEQDQLSTAQMRHIRWEMKRLIDLDGGVINITAEVSKVREPRKTVIQPNLATWLRAYPLKTSAVMVGDFKNRHQKFAKQLGLSHDVMRHTFISMFVAKYRSIGEAAIQAGNSEAIIRKHYLDLKSTAEAEEFFNILPRRAVVPKKACDNPVSPPSIAA